MQSSTCKRTYRAFLLDKHNSNQMKEKLLMHDSNSGSDPQGHLAPGGRSIIANVNALRVAKHDVQNLTGTLAQQAFVAAAAGAYALPSAETPRSGGLADVTSLRRNLWDSRFRPVAVLSHDAVWEDDMGECWAAEKGAGKRPVADAWQVEARQDPPVDATRPAVDRTRNTGILCDGLRAIDIDVDDDEDAGEIYDLAAKMLGKAPLRHRCNSARILMLYRAVEGEPPKRTLEGERHHPNGESSRVEVLGLGNQFVAFGRHSTGAKIEWWHGQAPGQFTRDDLTAITEDQITDFLNAVERVIGRKAPLVPILDQVRAQAPKAPGGARDPNFPAPTRDQACECLALIPPTTDYDTWLTVGAAVADVDSGPDGCKIWDDWSRGAGNYEVGACQTKWLQCAKMDRIHFGTLVALARHACGDPSWTPSRTECEGLFGLPAVHGHVSGFQTTTPNKGRRGIRIMSAAEAASLPPPEWLIQDVMQRGTLATIFGPPASLKSFLALHIANTIAYGTEWRGKPITAERVAYIAAEGASAVGAMRNEAWRIHYEQDVAQSRLDLIPHAVMLNDPAQVEDLIAALQERHGGDPYALVVVDTLARCSAGADEQSATAMGLVIDACARIKDALRCTVLLIHHTGKDATKGQRGSSALKGNVDMEAVVIRSDDGRGLSLKVLKMKDGEDGHWLQRAARQRACRVPCISSCHRRSA